MEKELKGYRDSFERFGVTELAVHNMTGKDIGIMCRYEDKTETALILPNTHALKLAKWILENVNGN